MAERFLDKGQLTDAGKILAGQMFNLQCDRRPCFMCSKQNRESKGPGGPDCPAAGKLKTGAEVDEILTAYMGRGPGLEALDSLFRK